MIIPNAVALWSSSMPVVSTPLDIWPSVIAQLFPQSGLTLSLVAWVLLSTAMDPIRMC